MDPNECKSLNKDAYLRKRVDKRHKNVYKSRSSNRYSSGPRMRQTDRVYHHAARSMQNALIKKHTEDLVGEDINFRINQEWKYRSTKFDKSHGQFNLSSGGKKNNLGKRLQKFIDKAVEQLGIKLVYHYTKRLCLENSLHERYQNDPNLLNSNLIKYIRGKAGTFSYTVGDFIKEVEKEGLKVQSISFTISDQFAVLYALLDTLYNFTPEVKAMYSHNRYQTSPPHLQLYNYTGSNNKLLNVYLYIYLPRRSYDSNWLYYECVGSVVLDQVRDDDKYYYFASDAGTVGYTKGHLLNQADTEVLSEDEEEFESKCIHYAGRVVEKGSIKQDDDLTSYDMGRLFKRSFII